jgi:hypothetical protein
VAYDKQGQPEGVLYHVLPALLLNEVQKQHRQLMEHAQTIAVLQQRLADLDRLLKLKE